MDGHDHTSAAAAARRLGVQVNAAGAGSHGGERSAGTRAARVLVVSSELGWVTRVMGLLSAAGIHCVCAGTLGAASVKWEEAGGGFDAAVIDQSLVDGGGESLAREVAGSGVPVVMASAVATLDGAVGAASVGACDLIGRSIENRALVERVCGAVRRGRVGVERKSRTGGAEGAERVRGLHGLCGSREEGPARVGPQGAAERDEESRVAGGGPTEWDARSRDQAPQRAEMMNPAPPPQTVASEFGGLIRHELDIEALLRTTLEFVLAKVGPTNAAVFLPTTSGDYSLGAYVNYDCPKETVDVLLDHLANAVAPRFQEWAGIAHLVGPEALARAIGDAAGWLADSEVLALACRHEGEVLAICMLFRDRRSPYSALLEEQMRTIGDLFAAQLARVIRIHHRHLPKDKWGAIGDTGGDEGESDGFGGGGGGIAA